MWFIVPLSLPIKYEALDLINSTNRGEFFAGMQLFSLVKSSGSSFLRVLAHSFKPEFGAINNS